MTSIPASASATAIHQPYIPASQSPPELTPRAITLGVLLGLIFGASNVYLALKIGLTVSASIPIAVLSITIFRALGPLRVQGKPNAVPAFDVIELQQMTAAAQ